MSNVNLLYKELIEEIIDYGEIISTRNSIAKRYIFGSRIVFNSSPLISLRKTAWKSALREMEWFLSGSNNIQDLHDSVKPWWEPWANKYGIILNNYSIQFKHFNGTFDQIKYLIDGIKNHPFSRRNLISTWNTEEMVDPETPITNCHGTIIQCFVDSKNFLHLKTYQRSVDVICGLPHNWIQYWALLQYLAHKTNRLVGKLIWDGGDVHIYQDHFDIVDDILEIDTCYIPKVPELIYKPTSEEFIANDFSLSSEYIPIITTKAKMIV